MLRLATFSRRSVGAWVTPSVTPLTARGFASLNVPLLNKVLESQPFLPSAKSVGVHESLEELRNQVLGTTWNDYFELVQNLPFWEAHLLKCERKVQRSSKAAGGEDTAQLLKEVQRLMDCVVRSEDVRDHINEIQENENRAVGIAATGYWTCAPISNMDEHITHILNEYHVLKKDYPDLEPKIEESVGAGIRALRQKVRFDYPELHQHFY
eukprot:GHVN01078613.1.p1 GENE.GHVN01078613.1~~GHVN01078613.1.p1  ORF type:complete len:210 (+),score=28.54 GHVN01078613.1:34-663(+)